MHRAASSRVLCAAAAAWLAASPAWADPDAAKVSALGRIEPRGGPVRVAGPSVPVAVISELTVDAGDGVKAGDVIARLDRYPLQQALVRQREAELISAEAELRRAKDLATGMAGAAARREDAEARVRAAKAGLDAQRAELELAVVRAPIDGRVLEVHARAGERVGPEGVVELGRTDAMVAVAEVYETDIGRVKTGQRAVVTSPALAKPQQGSVERVGLKIGRLDAVGDDPVAKTDARVVEVEIRLDEPAAVANLTNLQVEVEITP